MNNLPSSEQATSEATVRAHYYIALLPPAELCQEVTAFKEYAKLHFDSQKALNSPPHITLVPPFWYSQQQEQTLIAALQSFADSWTPILLTLNGFGHFSNRVLYIKVISSQVLAECREALIQHLEHSLDITELGRYSFHPHMTVAFRDLTPEQFEPAWEHFRDLAYCRKFESGPPALLRHNGSQWEVVANNPLHLTVQTDD